MKEGAFRKPTPAIPRAELSTTLNQDYNLK
jgi:hypothetical protein